MKAERGQQVRSRDLDREMSSTRLNAIVHIKIDLIDSNVKHASVLHYHKIVEVRKFLLENSHDYRNLEIFMFNVET